MIFNFFDIYFTRFYYFDFIILVCKALYVVSIALCLLAVLILPGLAFYGAFSHQHALNAHVKAEWKEYRQEMREYEEKKRDNKFAIEPTKPYGQTKSALLLGLTALLISGLTTILAAVVCIVLVRIYCEWIIFGVQWLLETKKAALRVINDKPA